MANFEAEDFQQIKRKPDAPEVRGPQQLPDQITHEQIKAKADSLWQQRAAVRPPSEGGVPPLPVMPVKTYQYR